MLFDRIGVPTSDECTRCHIQATDTGKVNLAESEASGSMELECRVGGRRWSISRMEAIIETRSTVHYTYVTSKDIIHHHCHSLSLYLNAIHV